MMKWVKEYLSFTRKERIAVFTLVALILGIYLLPRFIITKPDPPTEEEIAAFRKLEKQLKLAGNKTIDSTQDEDHPVSYAISSNENKPAPQLFYFDPNTIDAGDWKRLGLRDKTIGTIQKFLSKGGHFYKPGDLKKIYGLKEEEYNRIESYIRIASPGSHEVKKRTFSDSSHFTRRELGRPKTFTKTYTIIDVNTADTAAFIALPGIGSKLATRIVVFREKLGGFYAIEQVGETYGLPDSTFQKIRPLLLAKEGSIRQININTATLDVLKQHPYIRWGLASAIIRYREQHGPFTTPEQLQQIGAMTVEAYRKMAPYLIVK